MTEHHPEQLPPDPLRLTASPRVGIYYGSSGGTTRDAAERLADLLLQQGAGVTLQDIRGADLSELRAHDLLLIGCSTWNYGDLQDDWDDAFGRFAALDLSGVRAGFFGCGDQFGYPETFGDALGTLADAAENSGARLIGAIPAADYDFTASRAQRGELLVGLLLDDDNEPKKTPERLQRWAEQLARELPLAGRAPALNSE